MATILPLHSKRGSRTTRVPKNLTMQTFSFFVVFLFFIFSTVVATIQLEQPLSSPPPTQLEQPLSSPPPTQLEQPLSSPPPTQLQQPSLSPPPTQLQHPSAPPPQEQSQSQHSSAQPPTEQSQHSSEPPPPAQSQYSSAPPPTTQSSPALPIRGQHGRRRRNAAKFFGYVRPSHTSYLNNETELVAEFLHAHNWVRNEYKLPPLEWDEKLASFSKKYLMEERYNDCNCTHSTANYGENIFWGKRLHWTPCDAVYYWYIEKNSYDFNTLKCVSKSKPCEHFTQLVWRDTTHVGCALQNCKNSGTTGIGMLIICEYNPPGNYANENPLVAHESN